MKFNWGWAVVLVLLLFAATIVIRLAISFNQKEELVEEDYYSNQVTHQKMIDKKNNTAGLNNKVRLTITDDQVRIIFPDTFKNKEISGLMWFYRPSANHLDRRFEIQTDTTLVHVLDKKAFISGKYILKLDYQVNDISYYQEITLNLN